MEAKNTYTSIQFTNLETLQINYEKVVVTEVTAEGKVFALHLDEGPKLEALMKEIRTDLATNPPLAGAYQPKRGDLVRKTGVWLVFFSTDTRKFEIAVRGQVCRR